MEPECSLPYSQLPANCPYSEPIRSIVQNKLIIIIMFTSNTLSTLLPHIYFCIFKNLYLKYDYLNYLMFCVCGLHCIVLHCIVLHCTVLHCVVLHCVVLHCNVLHCIVLHCIVLHCIVLHCNVLHCISSLNKKVKRDSIKKY
jgi:hypothetical protein